MIQQCPNPGAFRYTWPGNDEQLICEICVLSLQQVAAALGLYLQIIPVPESEQWQCQQHIKVNDADQT